MKWMPAKEPKVARCVGSFTDIIGPGNQLYYCLVFENGKREWNRYWHDRAPYQIDATDDWGDSAWSGLAAKFHAALTARAEKAVTMFEDTASVLCSMYDSFLSSNLEAAMLRSKIEKAEAERDALKAENAELEKKSCDVCVWKDGAALVQENAELREKLSWYENAKDCPIGAK